MHVHLVKYLYKCHRECSLRPTNLLGEYNARDNNLYRFFLCRNIIQLM